MPASDKTEILGLSLWAGTDKPRRVDFVEDNQALEATVGGHVADAEKHLDAALRTRITAPFELKTYTGTGTASRSVILSFAPSAVIVFAVGRGASLYNGTHTKQYVGFSCGGQHGLGITLTGIQLRVSQAQTALPTGELAALNETGVTYAVMAFR